MINSTAAFLPAGYYPDLAKIKLPKFGEANQLFHDETRTHLLKINLKRIALNEWLLPASVCESAGGCINASTTYRKYTEIIQPVTADESKNC